METKNYTSINTLGFVLRTVVYLIVLGMVCLTGCREEEDSLEISISSLNFAFAGEKKVFILDSNTNWTVTVNNDATTWLTVSPVSGSKNGAVTVTADANSQKSQREATITVTGGDKVRTISVTQEGEALSVSETSMNFPSSGDMLTFDVASNISWKVSRSESWLTISPTSGANNSTVSVTAEANSTISQREATITVSGGDITQTISVTQSEGDAFLSVYSTNYYEMGNTENLFFESSNSLSKILYIHCNTNWVISSSESWLTVSHTSGSNDQTIEVYADYNTSSSRTATLTISTDGITRTIIVTQQEFFEQLYYIITFYTIPYISNVQTIKIYATISWEVTTDVTWLTLTPTSGTYDGSITMDAETNPFTYQRTAIITISGGGITRNITVPQVGRPASLTVSPTSLSFSGTMSQNTFNINSNTDWEVSSNGNWLSFAPSSGFGNGTVTVTAEENRYNSVRNATITVSTSDIQRTISVTQGVTILEVGSSTMNFSSPDSTTRTLSVRARADWTISSDVSWLTFSPTSGPQTASAYIPVDVTTSPNASTSPRNATITVSAEGTTRTVSVTQAGAVSTGSITFYTNTDRNCGYIRVTLSGQQGQVTKNITGWYNYNPGCGAGLAATFEDLPIGTYTYSASCGSYRWSGTVVRVLGCHTIRLN